MAETVLHAGHESVDRNRQGRDPRNVNSVFSGGGLRSRFQVTSQGLKNGVVYPRNSVDQCSCSFHPITCFSREFTAIWTL